MRLARLMFCVSLALAFVTLLTQPASSQNGDSERAPLVTTSLGDNIYLLTGDGANIVAISDDRSVLLIDSGTADRVTELAHAVYQVAQRPVTTVINTDSHADHAGGNPYFSSF